MTRLIVLFKKGDQSMPEHYRPIAILPILYKLFSRVLCERVKGMLNGAQTCDQAGFRSGYSCDDHLFAITMMIEISLEWNQPLWVAAIDFKKAFDTVEHGGLWYSLIEQGVPLNYVDVLMRLYNGQRGQVRTDRDSKEFDVQRGTKQGEAVAGVPRRQE